jgi:V-type H+-transporting ATPase subunit a
MRCVELVVPHDCAYQAIKCLASADLIHLTDNNTGAHAQEKRYSDDFIRCDDAQRCVHFIESQLTLYPKPTLSQFEAEAQQNPSTHRELLPNWRSWSSNLLRFYRPLLTQCSSALVLSDSGSMELELFLFSLTGVIAPSRIQPLFVTMYLASRGNILLSRGSDPSGSQDFFTVWFQTNILGRKLNQIATSYGATWEELISERADLTRVLTQSYHDNRAFQTKRYWFWYYFFVRESLIYRYMDYADFSQINDCAIYRGWIPARRQQLLQPQLDEAGAAAGSARRISFTLADTDEAFPAAERQLRLR